MWFDCVVIDRIDDAGLLQTHHIRSGDKEAKTFPIDRLEDIDPAYRPLDSADVGPIRVYDFFGLTTSTLSSKIRNYQRGDNEIYFQFDHHSIPVHEGYYILLMPIGWRPTDLHIYDPYSKGDLPTDNRGYRDIQCSWDSTNRISFTQFPMSSHTRDTFSMGVIARLVPDDQEANFIDRPDVFGVAFTTHGKDHALSKAFGREINFLLPTARDKTPERPGMPAINVGLTGPTVNIVDWAKYLRGRIRLPKFARSDKM